MMKLLLVIAFVAQVILFYAVFFAGTLADPFHLRWLVTHPSTFEWHFFNPSGLLLLLGAWVLVLLLESVLRRTRPHAVITTLALVVALALGFLSRIGFATSDHLR